MRTSWAIFNEMIDKTGRGKIAAALSVSESQTYKITEGERGIRPGELDGIFAAAAGVKSALQPAIELLSKLGHLVGARVVSLDSLYEIEGLLLAMKNGKAQRSILEMCPDCAGPVKVVGKKECPSRMVG